jgi:hypothetical protein
MLFIIGTIGMQGAMRAIASLGCERAKRAIASTMSPHVSPRLGPTPILCTATAGGITTVQTCISAAAKILPTTPTRERRIAARVKGYCTERAIFSLLRCTTDELFFSCCDSVAAHFKHASTRQQCMRGTAGIGLGTTIKYLRRTTSAAANNGLSANTKYLVN